MPIEVHCPNPICARIHQVKNRYAGMRGKCPDCGSWMYVPRTPQPDVVGTLAQPRAEENNGKPQPAGPVEEINASHLIEEETSLAESPSDKPTRTTAPQRSSPVEETEDKVISDQPVRQFSRFAAVLVFLGVLSLGAVAATPFVPPSIFRPTGDLTKALALETRPVDISGDLMTYIIGVPAGVAGVALLSWLIALISGRFGFLSLFLLYLVSLSSSLLLLLALHAWQSDTAKLARLDQKAREWMTNGVKGNVQKEQGYQLEVGVAGAAAAAGLFLLAVLVAHRRWWTRLFALVLLGTVAALAPVWVYRADLGVKEYVPREVEEQVVPYLNLVWR